MIRFTKPLFLINFKTYEQSAGRQAVKLAKAVSKVEGNIAIAPGLLEMATVVKEVSVPVVSQHVDVADYGAHTGSVLCMSIKAAGAAGTLINHSEKRVSFDHINSAIEECRDNGITSIVCVPDVRSAVRVARMKPDAIAFEPPELIGGTVSVSTAEPEVVRRCVEKVHAIDDIPVLIGAGVHTAEDLRIAVELGAKGVLVASGVVKAKNPGNVVKEMIRGFD